MAGNPYLWGAEDSSLPSLPEQYDWRKWAAAKAAAPRTYSSAVRSYQPASPPLKPDTRLPGAPGVGPQPGFDMAQRAAENAPMPQQAPPSLYSPGAPAAPAAAGIPSAAVRSARPPSVPSAGAPVTSTAGMTPQLGGTTPTDPALLKLIEERNAEKARTEAMQVEAMGIGPRQKEAEQLRKEAEGWGAPNTRMDYASQAARAVAGYKKGETTAKAKETEAGVAADVQKVIDNWKAAKGPKAKKDAVDELEQLGLSPEELARYTAATA